MVVGSITAALILLSSGAGLTGGMVELQGTLPGKGAAAPRRTVTVTIRSRDVDTAVRLDERVPWRWSYPNIVRVITGITICVGKAEWPVPDSAYADLVQVRSASLEPDKDGAVLLITGGDASTSFRARIFFDTHRVRRRLLYGEGAPEPVQETIFFKREIR